MLKTIAHADTNNCNLFCHDRTETFFFDDQKNIENINCYSNEGDKWMKSNIKLVEKELTIKFREPFLPRRGRINCSVNDNGKWRWFGTQFNIR